MDSKLTRFLRISFLTVGLIVLVFYGMSAAKGVLAPFFLAMVLSMMLVPVCERLEKWGLSRGWAALLADLLFVALLLGLFWVVYMEVQQIAGQWPKIQDRLNKLLSSISDSLGLESLLAVQTHTTKSTQNAQELQQLMQGMPLRNWFMTASSKILRALGILFLVVVYIFFMLFYRQKFRKGILKFVPEDKQEKAKDILAEILKDAQQYLFGRLLLVLLLTGIYAAGFFISGMKSAFTTALIAAVLSIIPYVGVLIGELLALGVAFVTTGSNSAMLIVAATLIIGQFVESYIIEPYLIGRRVNVNPLLTIFAIVVGGAVWGVIGMIIFLPLFSFIKAIADHIPLLHPLGYMIGKEDTEQGEGFGEKLKKKIKQWFS